MSGRRRDVRGHEQEGAGPSQRQLRVGEAMRHVLAQAFVRHELHDPALVEASLTVSEVRVSPDLKHASVFVAELGRERLRPETLKALIRAGALLGGRLAREMHLKYAPRLRFLEDTSFAEADRLERLISEEARRLPPAEEPR